MSSKLIISIATVFFTLNTYALTLEQQETYKKFRLNYQSILSSKVSKESFFKNFKNNYVELTNIYNQFEKLEGPDELTIQGNQMALDLEMLEPLSLIAESEVTKTNCKQSAHLNSLNQNSNNEIYQEINKILKIICK